MKKNLKKVVVFMMCVILMGSMVACGGQKEAKKAEENVKITLFAAASLTGVCDELIKGYQEEHPNVEIVTSYDSSGTLMEQIKEGAECDVFFSAATKQMDELEGMDLIASDTRKNVVNNQVCVVTYKDSKTEVTGLKDLSKAKSIALAGGSVPVGKYTRQAMVNASMLESVEDVSTIPTTDISKALGGVEINECANVSAVVSAVAEGSNEVGTVYKSDTYGKEDQVDILEVVSYDLTGNVIYPIAQVNNEEADDARIAATKDFIDYMTSDDAKKVYEKYYFDTDVE